MTAARVKILVEDVPQRSALGPMPESVELVAEPGPDVELVVLGLGLMPQVPALFDQLEGLRVGQAIFAGVDGLVASVPRDIGVAEWVVTTLLALRRRLPELLERQRHGEWDANVHESTATGASALGPIDDLDGP